MLDRPLFKLRNFLLSILVLSAFALLGCEKPADVVIYTSVDQQFAEQVIKRFEQESGLRVAAVFDTEAGKTTGLLHRLAREKDAPRCDVWWSSEIFGTIELARQGVLEKYESPAAADVAPEWKASDGLWTASAARARVLAFRKDQFKAADLPQTWREILQRDWKGRLAVANPLFGTTRGHLAAIFAYWGNDAAQDLLRRWADGGAKLADGNSQTVALLIAGQVDAAMTDTDDVWVAQARGAPLDLIYPRLDDDAPAVWIPCTTAVVRGAPHAAAARRLTDFLVSAAVEELLAHSDSRNVPVRAGVREKCGMADIQPQALDFGRVVDALPKSGEAARSTLLR